MGVQMDQLISISNKKILITNQVAETNKYLRHLVKDKSKSLYDFEVKSLSEIAKEVFFAFNSLYSPDTRKKVVNSSIQAVRLMSVLKNGNFDFLPDKSKDISSANEILRILNEIRMNNPSDYYLSSTDSRIVELRMVQEAYEKSLIDNNEMDTCMLYKAALESLGKVGNLEILMPSYIGAEYIDMWYGDMSSLEKSFIEAFIEKLGVKLQNLPVENQKETEPSYTFVRAYGVNNEVNYVKDKILDLNMPLGQVAIIYPTPEYELNLMAVLGSAGIPYSFSKGFLAKSTSYVQLMISLLDFAKGDFDCKVLDAVIDNTAFILDGKRKQYRRFVNKRIGWKRERYVDFLKDYEKKEEDTFIEFISKVISCFDESKSCNQIFHGLVSIVNEYTDTRDVYRACLKDAFASQEKVFSLAVTDSFSESLKLISDYLGTLRCTTSERPDMVSLLPFGREEMVDRENLFVLGLSNENIARTLVESPVLCDDDLVKCAGNKVNLAMEANKRRIEAFERMYRSSSASNIYLSYSYYDTVSLLDCSASLLYLGKLREAGLNDSDIETVTYKIDTTAKKIDISNLSSMTIPVDDDNPYKRAVQIPWQFSASSLQELLKCPLEYYYAHILHIPVVEHLDRNPDRWLPANKRGDIFHHTLEKYIKEAIIDKRIMTFDEDIFNKYFEKEVKKARIENPVPSETVYEDERDEAREVSVKYITNLLGKLKDSRTKVIGCEVGFEDTSYNDQNFELIFGGSVDRLDGEIDDDGVLQLDIIDYKTGRAEHKREEINAGVQIQHYVYPMAMLDHVSQNKKEIEGYFKKSFHDVAIRTVKYVFPYDEEEPEIDVTSSVVDSDFRLTDGISGVLSLTIGMLQQNQEQTMLKFATAVATEKKADKDHCQYCKFTNICRG